MKTTYIHGDYNVECERCLKKIKRSEARFDGQYRSMLVCGSCYDPKHPYEYPPKLGPENIAVKDARPRKAQADMQDYSFPAGEGITWDNCPYKFGEGIYTWS